MRHTLTLQFQEFQLLQIELILQVILSIVLFTHNQNIQKEGLVVLDDGLVFLEVNQDVEMQ